MNNDKLLFRSIFIIAIIALIIFSGCNYWSKANYRDYGKQGFDELKEITDFPEEYGSNIGNLDKNNIGQYIVFFSIMGEHVKNANEAFEEMERYAVTKDEKDFASSMVNYTVYLGKAIEGYKELLDFMNKNNIWDVSNPDPYLLSQIEKIQADMKVWESYGQMAELESKKAIEILDRMPEYHKDFAYLYESEADQREIQSFNNMGLSPSNLVYLAINIVIILIAMFPAYYLVRHKKMSRIKIISCLAILLFLFILSIIFNLSIVTLGTMIIIIVSIVYAVLKISSNRQENLNLKIGISINPDKKDNSIEYLKNFDKLSEKEIVAFLHLKNNPNSSRDKINELFGEETINLLVNKGYFVEDN